MGAYYYDWDEGQRWINWFEQCLVHVEGPLAGQPLKLMPWLEAVVRELFGWRRVEDGSRRYRTAFIFVPRKNAKTLLMAGLSLGLISIDGENKAQVYLAASTEDQAKLCFDMAADQIRISERLAEEEGADTFLHTLYELEESYLKIKHKASRGYIQVLSGVPKGKTGFNVHGGIFDEFHEITDEKLVGRIRTGIVSRKQPLMAYITTAGDNEETDCKREYDYACKVRDGIVDNDYYLTFICEASPNDEPGDPRTWKKANPGYGQSVNLGNLRALWQEAKHDKKKKKDFLQYHLNLWVKPSSDYVSYERWIENQQSYTTQDLYGREAFGGLDLAQSGDMNAFALIFPFWRYEKDEDDDELIAKVSFKSLVWYWVCQAAVDNSKDTKHPYSDWIQHSLEVTGGDIADYAVIRKRIKKICGLYRVREVGYDPYNAADIANKLKEKDEIEMVKIRQGFLTLNEPTKRFRDLVLSYEFGHNGNAILNYNIQSAQVVFDRNKNEMISKLHSTGRIDGLAAIHDALRLAMDAPPPPPNLSEHFSNGWSL